MCLAREIGNRIYECSSLLALGREYTRMGQASRAASLYGEALALARQQSDRSNECDASLALGQCSLETGDLAAARRHLLQAAELAEALGLKHPAHQAFEGLSTVCEADGDFAAALAFHKKFRVREKEVFNEAAERRSKALMVQMEVEKTQKEAELHRLKSVELAEANLRLQAQAELLQAQAEELRAQAEELERQAATDGLTGLANRRSLEGCLAREFAHARHSGAPLTVAMADIDHFKQINDRFGHQVGDEVLMAVALLLREACGPAALIARYGGEEFAPALPGASPAQGRDVCERVRRAVQGHAWGVIHPALAVTVSLGLSADLSAPSHERLLGLADEQLYQAKRLGRNRVCPQATLQAA